MIQKNMPLLLNLCYVGYNRGVESDFHPKQNIDGTWTTYCNQFVQYVCNGIGYDAFNGMNANEMVAFMSEYKNGWIPISEDVGQIHANAGALVLAGWKNDLGPHGHVAIVLPGILEKSFTYGKAVPKVVSIGQEVMFGKKLSFAFGANKQPTLFVLAGMI